MRMVGTFDHCSIFLWNLIICHTITTYQHISDAWCAKYSNCKEKCGQLSNPSRMVCGKNLSEINKKTRVDQNHCSNLVGTRGLRNPILNTLCENTFQNVKKIKFCMYIYIFYVPFTSFPKNLIFFVSPIKKDKFLMLKHDNSWEFFLSVDTCHMKCYFSRKLM
jgi:hypothetical protein